MKKQFSCSLILLGILGASAPSLANDNLSNQAHLFMQVQQLQREVASLRGMLEEQQNQIQQLQLNAQGYQPQQESQQLVEAQPATEPAIVAPEPQIALGDPAREQEFYDAAFSLVRKREFDTAKQAFSAFLQRYPQGQFTANAHYWLGEINLVEEDFQAAGRSFATVINNWPDHSKTPDAMYKLADVERRVGEPERARSLFQKVINEYPRSSAARLAQAELQRL